VETPCGLWGECSLQLHRIKINIDHAYKLPVTVSNRDIMIDHSTVSAQSRTLSAHIPTDIHAISSSICASSIVAAASIGNMKHGESVNSDPRLLLLPFLL